MVAQCQDSGILYTFGEDGHVFVLDARKATNLTEADERAASASKLTKSYVLGVYIVVCTAC